MTKSIEGMRVCLIGGAGFIGHNLALRLKELGANVSIIDGLSVNNLLAFRSAGDTISNRDLYLKIIQRRLDLRGLGRLRGGLHGDAGNVGGRAGPDPGPQESGLIPCLERRSQPVGRRHQIT